MNRNQQGNILLVGFVVFLFFALVLIPAISNADNEIEATVAMRNTCTSKIAEPINAKYGLLKHLESFDCKHLTSGQLFHFFYSDGDYVEQGCTKWCSENKGCLERSDVSSFDSYDLEIINKTNIDGQVTQYSCVSYIKDPALK